MSDVAPESQRRPPWASGRRVRRGIGSGIGRDSSMGLVQDTSGLPLVGANRTRDELSLSGRDLLLVVLCVTQSRAEPLGGPHDTPPTPGGVAQTKRLQICSPQI